MHTECNCISITVRNQDTSINMGSALQPRYSAPPHSPKKAFRNSRLQRAIMPATGWQSHLLQTPIMAPTVGQQHVRNCHFDILNLWCVKHWVSDSDAGIWVIGEGTTETAGSEMDLTSQNMVGFWAGLFSGLFLFLMFWVLFGVLFWFVRGFFLANFQHYLSMLTIYFGEQHLALGLQNLGFSPKLSLPGIS